jgi:hypothetical protein
MNFKILFRPERPLKFIYSIFAALSCAGTATNAGQFEVLGVPVKSVLIMGAAAGVDEKTKQRHLFQLRATGQSPVSFTSQS